MRLPCGMRASGFDRPVERSRSTSPAAGPMILELAGELADGVRGDVLDGPLLEASLGAGRSRRDAPRGEPRAAAAHLMGYVAIDDDREAARTAVRRGIAVAIWGSRPNIEELGRPAPRRAPRN